MAQAEKQQEPGAEGQPDALAADLQRAFERFEAGDWAEADARLEALAAREPARGDVLSSLAICRFQLGATGDAAKFLERAFTAFLTEGNQRSAVMCASHLVVMHELLGGDAAVHGWQQRGIRLVEEIGPCVEAGYIALAQTGCEVVDAQELARRADYALGLAIEFGDRDLEVRARADKGLALVSQGFVNAGFALLDEVMVAVVAGEVRDANTRGRSVCSVLSACERVGDIGRVEYWCSRIEQEPLLQHAVLFSHCRLVYGVAEALRGQWERAENHLLSTIEATASIYGHRAASIAKLAEIRLQQGRYAEAAALLVGFEDRVEAVPVLARLRLQEGLPEQSAALLRSAIRSLGDDAMRVAPLLALAVEVDLLLGDLAAALRHHERLLALDARCESNELRAYSRLGAGRIARHQGDSTLATEELETALTLLMHYERPLLVAQIRLELARAFASQDDVAAARVEVEAALSTFRRVGNVHDATQAETLLKTLENRHAAPLARPALLHSHAGLRQSTATAPLTSREREVAELVSRGLTNREIADSLVLSVRTIEGHVDRILGKLDFHTRTQLAMWVGQAPDGSGGSRSAPS